MEQVDGTLKKLLGDLCRGIAPWPLYLHGSTGTGKTCAALSVSDFVCGVSFYKTAQDLGQWINDAQWGRLVTRGENGSDYPVSASWCWGIIENRVMVVLDELGQTRTVPSTQYDAVYGVADRRQYKPTIYISNLSPADLAQAYDDRVVSRVCSGTVFELIGPDRRLS